MNYNDCYSAVDVALKVLKALGLISGNFAYLRAVLWTLI